MLSSLAPFTSTRAIASSFLLLIIAVSAPRAIAERSNLESLLKNGSTRVETAQGKALITHRETDPFIPASTIKVATAFCALEVLGRDHHFTTELYADSDTRIFIRGSGDPSLVSEELHSLAKELSRNLSHLDSIVIDASLFDESVVIDGYSGSLNPYDSRNSAFVGNFSSAYISRDHAGAIQSAETQTPLTPLAVSAGQKLPKGKTERINLGKSARIGALYGGELLAAFLRKAGVSGPMRVNLGVVPSSARRILSFKSSQDLASIVRGMLKYSTNFTANQIFLVLGSVAFGGPATVSKAQRAMQSCLENRVGWRDFHVEEGAGLSRRNRVSSRLMTQLLAKFEPYRDLMPEEDGFFAKTGTLRGVNTLIGYFDLPGHGMARFSVLVNSEVPHLYKFQVARTLRSQLMGR